MNKIAKTTGFVCAVFFGVVFAKILFQLVDKGCVRRQPLRGSVLHGLRQQPVKIMGRQYRSSLLILVGEAGW